MNLDIQNWKGFLIDKLFNYIFEVDSEIDAMKLINI